LLTAKPSNKIKGYEAGADFYIAKPFNFEVLLTRIEMLIKQQEKRRKLFHKTIETTPYGIIASSLDEELIKKALLVMGKTWTTPNIRLTSWAMNPHPVACNYPTNSSL
jgi:DNA-binding response OmpR family regulator